MRLLGSPTQVPSVACSLSILFSSSLVASAYPPSSSFFLSLFLSSFSSFFLLDGGVQDKEGVQSSGVLLRHPRSFVDNRSSWSFQARGQRYPKEVKRREEEKRRKRGEREKEREKRRDVIT